MTNQTNIDAIIAACDFVASKVTTIGGEYHSSSWLMYNIMRAFKFAPAEAVTYSVHFNAPVDKDGEVTIHRDGSRELRLV